MRWSIIFSCWRIACLFLLQQARPGWSCNDSNVCAGPALCLEHIGCCVNDTEHITEFATSSNDDSPCSEASFGGSLPEAIGSYENLIDLVITDQGKTGSVPSAIGALRSMQVLNLNSNQLSGSLPDAIGALTSMLMMQMDSNQLRGSLPDAIGSLVKLVTISFTENLLSGTLPETIGALASIVWMYLDSNQLSGSLPDAIGSLTHLVMMSLDENQLAGSLPDVIGGLTTLWHLRLQRNQLMGSIPEAIGTFTSLRSLHLDSNELAGSLPESISLHGNLLALYLFNNKFSGPLPSNVDAFPDLSDMLLSNNQLVGSLPSDIGSLTSLQNLELHSNKLEGALPAMLGSMQSLKRIQIHTNQLTGALPQLLGSLSELIILLCQTNKLTGSIPDLSSLTSLVTLNMENNAMTGSLPQSLPRYLRYFVAGGNRLEGSLPDGWQTASAMILIVLQQNGLTGPLPDYSSLTPLQTLDVSVNSLEDELTASSMIFPPQLKELYLYHNNHLGGTLPDQALASELEEVDVTECRFSHVATLGPRLSRLDISYNQLTEIPWSMRTLPLMQILSVRGNQIDSWPKLGLIPSTRITSTGDWDCYAALHAYTHYYFGPPLFWPRLTSLDLSENPLDMDVFVFLQSLFLARRLVSLAARDCQLYGEVLPLFFHEAIHCNVRSPLVQALPLLQDLDLGGNQIEAIYAVPPPNLFEASLDSNMGLHTIPAEWFNRAGESRLQRLHLTGNPQLQFSVRLPLTQGCLRNSTFLVADPSAYSNVNLSLGSGPSSGTLSYECTVPCTPGSMIELQVDAGIPDTGSLCRCQLGYGFLDGNARDATNGVDCELCPASTYSFSEASDPHRTRSVCRDCPQGAVTDGGGQQSPCSCECPRNSFLSIGEQCNEDATTTAEVIECSECPVGATTSSPGQSTICSCLCPQGQYLNVGQRCDEEQWPPSSSGSTLDLADAECIPCEPFKTTDANGTMGPLGCVCDSSIPLLAAQGRDCGCPSDHFFNYASFACEECRDGENCEWGYDINRSVRPPDLQPGYWADTGGLVGENLNPTELAQLRFSGHRIYKCFSTETCIDSVGTCATSRHGTACSLCLPDHFGGPDGACTPCEGSVLAAMALVICGVPLIVAVAHSLLKDRDHSTLDLLLALRGFRTSVRQLLKHAQVMAVVSGFTIGWPIDVERVWKVVDIFSFQLGSIAGFACLTGEQTASLELYVRWAMPLVFAFIGVVLSPIAVEPVAFLLTKCSPSQRLQTIGQDMRIRWTEAGKAVFWLLLLVFPTLLNFGFAMFTCNRHPNDEMTVASFPHLHCLGSRSGPDDEWMQLMPAGLAYNLIFLGGMLAFYVRVLHRTLAKMQASGFASRGAQYVFFEDFRDPAVHWPLLLIGRDIMVNISQTVFNNYGTLQLLFTGLCSLFLAGKVAAEWPYVDGSNNVLEIINALSIFTVCIFTAGMGFAEEPGVESLAKLTKGRYGFP